MGSLLQPPTGAGVALPAAAASGDVAAIVVVVALPVVAVALVGARLARAARRRHDR